MSDQPESANSLLAAKVAGAIKSAGLITDKYAKSLEEKLSTGQAKEADWRLWAEDILIAQEKSDDQACKD